jgi:hypothetical protein
MKTCGTCKHFSPDLPTKWCGEAKGFGTCMKITTLDSHRCCGEVVAPEAKAFTVDGSDYFSAILCREDFGCTLHEELQQS